MTEIIPAIMPDNLDDLKEKLEKVRKLVAIVQVDIMDGVFVPSISWPYDSRGKNSFEKIIIEDEGLPYWKDLNFEVDLMVSNPEEKVKKYIEAGFFRVIFHLESAKKPQQIIKTCREFGAEVGVAIRNSTSLDNIAGLENQIDVVQCMGIDQVGFQGQPFDIQTINKIKEVKKRFPQTLVSVDGGVSLKNFKSLKKAGADRLVVGSALFESVNIVETFELFKKQQTKK